MNALQITLAAATGASQISRNQKRREHLRDALAQVEQANVRRDRHGFSRTDSGGNMLFAISRKERHKLARAYAKKAWRERAA